MKRSSQRHPQALNVHRVAKGTQLVLSDSDTVILVIRGACALRDAKQESERFAAGALILQNSSAGVLDRRVARALGMLHTEPAKAWTVQRLARAVGLSRAAFARRFVAVTGRSPARFLSQLRLSLAASMLENTDDSVAEVALRVGYASEFAFSRAFRRQHGIAPGSYRRLQQAAHSSPIRLAA